MSVEVSFNLGPEYDGALWQRLRGAIKYLGGYIESNEWGIAGSQEVIEYKVVFGSNIILVESETYIGITITGDAELINKIKEIVEK